MESRGPESDPEIQAALGTVLNMAAALAGTSLDPKQHELLRMVRRAAETLEALIALREGRVRPEQDRELDLLDTVENLVDGLANWASRRGVELETRIHPDVPTRIAADGPGLRQRLLPIVVDALVKGARNVVMDVTSTPLAGDRALVRFRVGGAAGGRPGSIHVIEVAVTAGSTRAANSLPDLTGIHILLAEPGDAVARVFGPAIAARGGRLHRVNGFDAIEEEIVAARVRGIPFHMVLIDQALDPGRVPRLGQALLASRDPVGTPVLVLGPVLDPAAFDSFEQRGLRWLTRPLRLRALGALLAQVLDLERPGEARSCAVQSTKTLPRARSYFVLLVEDSTEGRRIVEEFVEGTGITLDLAANGQEAMERFSRHSYDLVLMDVHMPVMDGLVATRMIRQWERDHRQVPTPILALSSHGPQHGAREAREAGCDDHLTKPVSRAALLSAIAARLGVPGLPGTPGGTQ